VIGLLAAGADGRDLVVVLWHVGGALDVAGHRQLTVPGYLVVARWAMRPDPGTLMSSAVA
jgi:hypothetical protein